MMSLGVERMDELFVRAHAAGIVRGDPDLIIQPPPPPEEEEEEEAQTAITVFITAPNDAWRDYGIAVIRSIPGVAISGSGSSVSVTYSGGVSALRDQLVARGLTATFEGGGIRLFSVPRAAAAPPAQPQPSAGQTP